MHKTTFIICTLLTYNNLIQSADDKKNNPTKNNLDKGLEYVQDCIKNIRNPLNGKQTYREQGLDIFLAVTEKRTYTDALRGLQERKFKNTQDLQTYISEYKKALFAPGASMALIVLGPLKALYRIPIVGFAFFGARCAYDLYYNKK